jgi:hypothetical protein
MKITNAKFKFIQKIVVKHEIQMSKNPRGTFPFNSLKKILKRMNHKLNLAKFWLHSIVLIFNFYFNFLNFNSLHFRQRKKNIYNHHVLKTDLPYFKFETLKFC